MKHLSVRLRYLAGYMLVLVPILLFSLALFSSTIERSTQYINTASLQRFTYAAENISAIVSRLEASATSALTLEAEIQRDEFGRSTVISDDRLCEILDTMEERLYPRSKVLFYLRGDSGIYTAQGRFPFDVWEDEYASALSLPMSKFFVQLMSIRESALIPLKPVDLTQSKGGVAYVALFPVGDALPTAMIVYLMESSLIEEEFTTYLGSLPGDIYLYDSLYTQLYTYTASDEPLMPYDDMMKVRGTGVQQVEYGGKKLVLLKTPDIQRNLHCAMVVEASVFYAELDGTRTLMLVLVGLMVAIICVMAVWLAFFNYKPIGDLVAHITGAEPPAWQEQDELALIRSAFDERTNETERLNSYLLELQPVISQQLVRKLIAGKINTRDEFLQLARNADIPFTRPHNVAMCIPSPLNDGEQPDSLLPLLTRFQPARSTVCWGELVMENVLCVIVNFACEEGEDSQDCALHLARQLCIQLGDGLPCPLRIGVGRVYDDPLLLPESYAEARTAIQLAPHNGETVFLYDPRPRTGDMQAVHSIADSPAMGLLIEGVRRGEKSVALRAFDDLIRLILDATESFAYFRFCSAEVLTHLVHQAGQLRLNVDQKQISRLIDYKTQAEFAALVRPFLSDLCDRQHEAVQQEDSLLNQRVLDYILDSYKRPDLSIQLVSDELHVPKGQITVLLRESVGQNFVQYVSYLRMNEFKRLLQETDKTIKDCVMEIGYCDVPNFLRKFKSIEGMTPGQYRATHSQQA